MSYRSKHAKIKHVTFSVEYSSRSTLDLTNSGTHMRANRLNLTIVGILVAGHVGLASAADSFEDDTFEALKLCGAIGQLSVDDCSRSIGKSAEHSAARKALVRMFDARTAFMNNCWSTDRYPSDCSYMADWHFWRGFNRAANEAHDAKAIK